VATTVNVPADQTAWNQTDLNKLADGVVELQGIANGGSLPYNVKQYGAKGNGVTDDTAAIQAAISAANTAGGGWVYFPVGIFIISASLVLHDDVHLIGPSANFKETTKGATIQTAAAGTLAGSSAPMVNVNNTKYAGVHRLSFVVAGGNNTNTTYGISDFSDTTHQATFLTVEDCSFNFFGGEVIALYGNVNYIMRNRADNCGARFIHLKTSGGGPGAGSDNFVAFNDGGSPATSAGVCSAGEGIYLDQVSNNTIIGNHMYGMLSGISISASSAYNRIENNRCEKNVDDGITDAGQGDMLVGNHCFNNGWTASKCGINLNGSTETLVSSNYLNNNASLPGGTNQLYGVLLNGASRCQIVDNHVYNVGNYGIELRAASGTNLISNNYVSSTGQHAIHLTGSTNNTVQNNFIWNCGLTTDATYDGIRVEGASTGCVIRANTVRKVTANNKVKYAVNIADAGSTGCTVFGNDLEGAGSTAAVNNAAGATTNLGSNRYTTGAVSGRAVLAGTGTVTVPTTEIVAADNVTLSRVLAGGTLGNLSVGTIVPGTSFVINSDNAADTSTIYWEIRH
jgi:parallel beta-helix repeat protein